jgi:hypothetical protein
MKEELRDEQKKDSGEEMKDKARPDEEKQKWKNEKKINK